MILKWRSVVAFSSCQVTVTKSLLTMKDTAVVTLMNKVIVKKSNRIGKGKEERSDSCLMQAIIESQTDVGLKIAVQPCQTLFRNRLQTYF